MSLNTVVPANCLDLFTYDSEVDDWDGTTVCMTHVIPATSHWGLVATFLLLLIAGTLCFGRRRAAAA
jgi:hypothetical protein